MAQTNFDRFRQKLEASKAKKQSTSSNWFKAETGKRYQLRFLPLKNEDLELPLTIYHHHAVTFPDGHFESIACPKKQDMGECPFCDLAWKTFRTYTKTENEAYKDAFKKLVVKTHYLLVGYEADAIDPSNITEADLKIVRVSSKTNMELLESKLEKGVDFCDFTEGRIVEYSKSKATTKGGFDTIVLDFGDKSVAFDKSEGGKKTWDLLVEKSPDLSSIVTPLKSEELKAKFAEFSSGPVEHEEEERTLLSPKPDMKKAPSKITPAILNEDDGEIDLDELRSQLD
jgi:hypothetical protein